MSDRRIYFIPTDKALEIIKDLTEIEKLDGQEGFSAEEAKALTERYTANDMRVRRDRYQAWNAATQSFGNICTNSDGIARYAWGFSLKYMPNHLEQFKKALTLGIAKGKSEVVIEVVQGTKDTELVNGEPTHPDVITDRTGVFGPDPVPARTCAHPI